MTTLSAAHREWSSRPADERFPSLEALHADALAARQTAAVASIEDTSLHCRVIDGEIILNGKSNVDAKMTNWSFGQIAAKASAPASYLRTLPAPLAAECINTGLAGIDNGKSKLLLDRGGALTLRAINGLNYGRIWDHEITERLLDLKADGWHEAPAAFDGSRGQYRGDRSMFSFMVDSDRRIFERAPGGGLSRGFFAWNSEVGGGTFGGMRFAYNYVCGNHYVWGASDISEFRVRHVGNAAERGWSDWHIALKAYHDSSAETEEMEIARAMQFQIGATKKEVLDAIFGLKVPALSRKVIGEALEIADRREDWYGNPLSAWGVASGLTEIARDYVYADAKVELERGAGKVIEMAF